MRERESRERGDKDKKGVGFIVSKVEPKSLSGRDSRYTSHTQYTVSAVKKRKIENYVHMHRTT